LGPFGPFSDPGRGSPARGFTSTPGGPPGRAPRALGGPSQAPGTPGGPGSGPGDRPGHVQDGVWGPRGPPGEPPGAREAPADPAAGGVLHQPLAPGPRGSRPGSPGPGVPGERFPGPPREARDSHPAPAGKKPLSDPREVTGGSPRGVDVKPPPGDPGIREIPDFSAFFRILAKIGQIRAFYS